MAKRYSRLGLIGTSRCRFARREGRRPKFLARCPPSACAGSTSTCSRCAGSGTCPTGRTATAGRRGLDRVAQGGDAPEPTAKSYADEAADAPSVHGSSMRPLAEVPLAPRLEEIKSLLASGAISGRRRGLRERFFDARDAAAAEAEERDAFARARTSGRRSAARDGGRLHPARGDGSGGGAAAAAAAGHS